MDPIKELEANVIAAKENVDKQKTPKQKEDLAKAMPALKEAGQALDCLAVKDVQELKSLKAPPGGVGEVCEAVMHLFYTKVTDKSWNASRKMMAKPGDFLTRLKNIDVEKLPKKNVEAARKIKNDMGATFSYDAMRVKSAAAAGLCVWVINVITYYDVMMQAKPQALREAEEALNVAVARLAEAKRDPKHDKVLQVFKQWDANGDGIISADEMKTALLKIGMSEKNIATAIEEADMNLDHVINYEEFLVWVYTDPCETLKKVISDSKGKKSQAVLDALAQAGKKVSTITKKDINEVKKMAKPPGNSDKTQTLVVTVFDAVALLLGYSKRCRLGFDALAEDWTKIQDMLADKDFLAKVCSYDPSSVTGDILQKLITYTSEGHWAFACEVAGDVSLVAGHLVKWVVAIKAFAEEQ